MNIKDKFWFHALSWISWAGFAMLTIYTVKPEVRLISILILLGWAGAVIVSEIVRQKKIIASQNLTFKKWLLHYPWLVSFLIVLFVSLEIWGILSTQHPLLTCGIILAGAVLIGGYLVNKIKIKNN